jgi:hypothetical protein
MVGRKAVLVAAANHINVEHMEKSRFGWEIEVCEWYLDVSGFLRTQLNTGVGGHFRFDG